MPPSSGDFIPISTGSLPPATAIGLVKSVTMKPGVQPLTLRFGYFPARNIVYALVQALDNPYLDPAPVLWSEVIFLLVLASMHFYI